MDSKFPHDKYKRQPARRFEKEFGLKGIAGRYRFPDEPGMDCASIEKQIDKLLYNPENIARQLEEFIAERQLPKLALSLKQDSRLGRALKTPSTNSSTSRKMRSSSPCWPNWKR